MIGLLIAGCVILSLLIYAFSVRAIFAVRVGIELGKGYETTEHPEHDKWAEERGAELARERAGKWICDSRIVWAYCTPYFIVETLISGDEEIM
jgi:hypothetical protein